MVSLDLIINQIVIQFVVNSDLIMTQRICNLILLETKELFNLALETSHRITRWISDQPNASYLEAHYHTKIKSFFII